MRALSYQGPFTLTVENKPDPRIEHPQDTVLHVTRAAICGSDLHLNHGLIADCRVTWVVEEVGAAVDNLSAAEMGDIKPGETVAVFGCGPVGFFAMRSAWLMGAGRVIAVDYVPTGSTSPRPTPGWRPSTSRKWMPSRPSRR